VVIRDRDRDNPPGVQGDASLSHAVPGTSLGAWARVATAEQRSDACLQSSKSAAGLADDAGRQWTDWHHQHPRAFLAPWFLVRETERGKKLDPCDDLPADSPGHGADRARGIAVRHAVAEAEGVPEAMATP